MGLTEVQSVSPRVSGFLQDTINKMSLTDTAVVILACDNSVSLAAGAKLAN